MTYEDIFNEIVSVNQKSIRSTRIEFKNNFIFIASDNEPGKKLCEFYDDSISLIKYLEAKGKKTFFSAGSSSHCKIWSIHT